jgi:hypothetical protein
MPKGQQSDYKDIISARKQNAIISVKNSRSDGKGVVLGGGFDDSAVSSEAGKGLILETQKIVVPPIEPLVFRLERFTSTSSGPMAADGNGNFYIKSKTSSSLNKITEDGVFTLNTSVDTSSSANWGISLTYYNGLVYMVDGDRNIIQSYNPSTRLFSYVNGVTGSVGDLGVIQTGVTGSYKYTSYLSYPNCISSDTSGNLYVSNYSTGQIFSFAISNNFPTIFNTGGYLSKGHNYLGGFTLNGNGTVVVFDTYNRIITGIRMPYNQNNKEFLIAGNGQEGSIEDSTLTDGSAFASPMSPICGCSVPDESSSAGIYYFIDSQCNLRKIVNTVVMTVFTNKDGLNNVTSMIYYNKYIYLCDQGSECIWKVRVII